jgi:hypothetical protein
LYHRRVTDVRDPASLLEAAQQAVGEGDHDAAERLLREAVSIQEATLGASHPDLATTLNNLAFVCERTGKLDEAERGYRRAHAIAVASLSPGHPLIATSLTNLLEFCAARGIPVFKPSTAQAEDAPDADAVDEPSTAEVVPEVEDEDAPPLAARRSPMGMIAAAVLGVAAIVVLFLMRSEPPTNDAPRSAPEVPQASVEPTQPAASATTPSAAPATTAAASSATTPVAASQPVVPRESQPVASIEPKPTAPRESVPPAPPERGPATTAAPVTVLNAQLCSALKRTGLPDWQCRPANADGKPGTYFFYTRLLTKAGTTVEHRWYRSGRLHQTMRLRVPPNPGNGYRTFSSNSVSSERTGDWRVELRASDGSVLHEERFVVR